MFAHVKLLHGFQEPLWYEIPDSLIPLSVGTMVRVPIRNQRTAAVITAVTSEKPVVNFALKKIIDVEQFPADPHYYRFITQLSAYYQIDQLHLIKRIRHFVLHEKPISLPEVEHAPSSPSHIIQLTNEQEAVYQYVAPFLAQPTYVPTLLHGITGSGKTEVYKKLIADAYALQKTSLLLLPEVTLALQFYRLLKQQLPNVLICNFHSGMTPKEKQLVWQHLIEQQPMLIIGVHMPVLLPISNLGLIIVDEEHDAGYQEKKHPKMNSKEIALLRAQQRNIPIVLGSATPSVTSLYNAAQKKWKLFALTKRFGGTLPSIKHVLLSDKKRRPHFWISTALADAIADRISRREQVIIFINRRGFSFFIQCKNCNHIYNCAHCSVTLTLHDDRTLSCHYCGFHANYPTACSSCSATDFLHKGIGTQQVAAILSALFPQARIARADLDITAKKKSWADTVKKFQAGDLDILVGTQTITKGYHFPNVTLVGVIWADLQLNFPVYNASELALQQLIQVAGRAGRASHESLVIVQSMHQHALFDYIDELQYQQFYAQEIANRQAVLYPPCIRLVEIELKHSDEKGLEDDARTLAARLKEIVSARNLPVTILGPAKPPVHKIKQLHMRKIYLKCRSMKALIEAYQAVDKTKFNSSIFFTPNPMS